MRGTSEGGAVSAADAAVVGSGQTTEGFGGTLQTALDAAGHGQDGIGGHHRGCAGEEEDGGAQQLPLGGTGGQHCSGATMRQIRQTYNQCFARAGNVGYRFRDPASYL